jgi:diguanylate cyclase (GGDEF)-like protein
MVVIGKTRRGPMVDASQTGGAESTDPSSHGRDDFSRTSSNTADVEAGDDRATTEIAASVILIAHPDDQLLGRRFDLSVGRCLTIGRSPEADISLPEVRSMSRMHARVEHRGSRVVIEDLGSTNGTNVNDERVQAATPLHSGDRFQVGSCHFKLLHDRDVEHAYHQAVYNLVVRDGLTDVFNKRKFEEEMAREFSRARRYDRPLCLVLFDLDHFKRVNDTHGHLCGDAVLHGIAARVRRQVRTEQVFARVGGEEFAILCPETEAEDARLFAERLRSDIGEAPLRWGETDVVLTCSFGIAQLGAGMTSAEDLYRAADRGMYVSKNSGRNMVTVDTDDA